MEEKLAELRTKIDALDNELITLLASRMNIVREIGALKREAGLPALDSARWNEVVNAAKAAAMTHGLSEKLVEDVFNAVHTAALEIEQTSV